MTSANYGVLTDSERIDMLLTRIADSGKDFAFDIESGYSGPFRDKGSLLTYSPNWYLVGISFSASTNWAQYVPIAHDEGGNVDDVVRVARAFWRLLNTGNGVAHNAMMELNGCARWFRDVLWDDPEVGEEVRESKGFFPIKSDTFLEAFILGTYAPANAGGPGLGLKSLVKYEFGHEMTELKKFFMKEGQKSVKRDIRFSVLPVSPAVVEYGCEDSKWTYDLHEKNYPKVKDQFIFKVEIELLRVLVEMEYEGLLLNWGEISRKADEALRFKDVINEEILAELSKRLGENVELNLGSPKQLATVLYERLNLPVKEYTEKGAASTSESAVRALAKEDPIIKRILEWREVNKLYGSYLNKYRTELNYHPSQRAFPSHNQAGAATGRFSVDRVSYQQWPKFYHYESGQDSFDLFGFRDFLISPEDYRIVGYDFSQVELRVLAGMADETALKKAFADGIDIHKATASNMMGIDVSKVTKKLRAVGKTLNFAVVYGSGAQNIADMLTSPDDPVTKDDAEGYLEKYYAGFPNLRGWMDKKIVEGHETGYVETPFGRKFTVWEFTSANNWIRSKGDRMCVNAPVQGGAADYMKIGMVRARKAIRKAEKDGLIPVGGIRMIMTIHDALEFYVHKDVATQTVIDIISPVTSFSMPGWPNIKADWHEGYQWGAVAEINLDADRKISGYELVAELPWTKEEFSWEGETLHEVLDGYYQWEYERFDWSHKYYQTRNPGWKPDETKKNSETEDAVRGGTGAPEDGPAVGGADPISPDSAGEEATPVADTSQPQDAADDEPVWAHRPEVRAEAGAEVVDEGVGISGGTVAIVSLTEMPNDDQWSKFQDVFLADRIRRPGSVTLSIETPEGSMTMDDQYLIEQSDQGEISLLLGGASLRFIDQEEAEAPMDVDDLLDSVL